MRNAATHGCTFRSSTSTDRLFKAMSSTVFGTGGKGSSKNSVSSLDKLLSLNRSRTIFRFFGLLLFLTQFALPTAPAPVLLLLLFGKHLSILASINRPPRIPEVYEPKISILNCYWEQNQNYRAHGGHSWSDGNQLLRFTWNARNKNKYWRTWRRRIN